MAYTLISATQNEDTITTTVDIELSTGTSRIEIAHFRPDSIEVIHNNILDRILSEQSKIDAYKNCQSILPQLLSELPLI
jgi:hypothetical protein